MRCKNCKDKFEPKRFNWKYCEKEICNNIGVKELVSKTRKQKEQQRRKQTKEAKEKIMTRSDWLKKLELSFNKFIRERDKDKPCISCGAAPGTYTLTCGHFWPAGNYSFLRFNELNCHGQCWYNCNKNKHGNIGEYRLNITSRISEEDLNWIDENRHNELNLTIEEIKDLIKVYKDKIKFLT